MWKAHKMTHWILLASRRWWLFLIVLAANVASFLLLFALEDRFEAISGVPVWDTQNGLIPSALLQQLPLYEGAARTAYLRFAAWDFVFPFVAALFLAVLWAFLLGSLRGRAGERLLAWQLPLLPFLGTLFDWLENVSLLAILYAGPAAPTFVVNAAILFKRLKLSQLTLGGAVTVALLLFTAANWLLWLFRRRDGPYRVRQ